MPFEHTIGRGDFWGKGECDWGQPQGIAPTRGHRCDLLEGANAIRPYKNGAYANNERMWGDGRGGQCHLGATTRVAPTKMGMWAGYWERATTRVARTKMGKGNLEGFVKGYIDGEVIGIPADILAGLERSVWSMVAGIGIGCVH